MLMREGLNERMRELMKYIWKRGIELLSGMK